MSKTRLNPKQLETLGGGNIATDDEVSVAITVHKAESNPHNQYALVDAITKSSLGLGNVDNTNDINKPVSTAQAVAIAVVQNQLNADEVAYTAAIVGKVNITDIVNTLTSTNAAVPLSAAQGKVLNDAITAVQSVPYSGVIPYHGLDRTTHSISYVSATRTLTLTQTTGNFSYWYNGQLIITNSPSVSLVHSNTPGNYNVYFNSNTGVLQSATSFPGSNLTICQVAFIYWDGIKGTAWDDRHGYNFPLSVHAYGHANFGARLVSGIKIGGYTIQDGTADSSVKYTLTSGVIADEDVQVNIAAQAAGGPYSCWHRDTSTPGWGYMDANTLPYSFGSYIQYNNGTVKTDLVSGQYVNYWIYGAPIFTFPQTFAICGQKVFTNLADALAESVVNLVITGLPSKEFVPLFKITYRADTTYNTSGHACIFAIQPLNENNGGNDDIGLQESLQYLDMLATVEPPAPGAGHLGVYASSVAGKLLLNWTTPDSIATQAQPALFGNNIVMWLPGTSSTLSVNFGSAFIDRNNGNNSGQTTPRLNSTNSVTQMKRASFNTGSSTSGTSGISTTDVVAWRGNITGCGGFYFFARFALETYASNERIFIGLSATNSDLNSQPSSIHNSIGICKDTDDTTLQLLTVNASGNITKINTGVTPNTSQILDFTMFCKPNDTKVTMSLAAPTTEGMLVNNTVLTTNLPASDVFMYMQALIQSLTGTTSKTLSVNRLYLETET